MALRFHLADKSEAHSLPPCPDYAEYGKFLKAIF
jgi:hypothetical protein